MIQVIFYQTTAKQYSGFSLSGHSGYAEAGSDIVCASVTAASQLSMNLLKESFGIDCDIKIDSKKAAISCIVQTSEHNTTHLDVIFGILDGFYKQILYYAEEYPHHIRCTLTERNGLS